MLYNYSEEDAKKLGFNSSDEMLLYHDVCGFDIVPPTDGRDEMIERCLDDTLGRTKSDFKKYINDNGLKNLFNSVKDLSMFERFIELYNYNFSLLLISDRFLGFYNRKIKELHDIYDFEKESIYKQKAKKIFTDMHGYMCRKNDLKIDATYRLLYEEQEKFYTYIDLLENHMQDLKNMGRRK